MASMAYLSSGFSVMIEPSWGIGLVSLDWLTAGEEWRSRMISKTGCINMRMLVRIA